MKLHTLKPADGSIKSKKRIARGQGSGRGGTSTKGHKGAQSRSGYSRKFGFRSPNRIETKPINLDVLQNLVDKLKLKEIDPDTLVKNGLAKKNSLIKILGRGKIKSKINIKSHMFSKSAIKSIEKVGGKVQIISND